MPGRAKSGGGEGAEAAASADAEVLGLRAASSRSSSAEFNEYLRKQAHLLDLRIADHPFEKAHLRVRRWQDRAQIAVLGGLAALLAALTVLIAGMTVKAVTAHDIVVEPFTVAPELAARGLTGAVVAQHVLDQVAAIDQATVSTLQGPARYRDGREEPIKIEIPETGVSLSDLDRYLRRWLGHETHVSGEVVRSGAGY